MTFESLENNELLAKYNRGEDEAKELLVNNNLALVKSIARRYSNRNVTFEDLVEIGTIGLLKAIDGFDEKLGYAFSTYAFTLISGEIKRHLRDDGIIKVSRKLKKNAALVMAAKEKYLSDYGKEPKISILCQLCGLSCEEVTECIDACLPVRSISEPLCDGSDMTLGDTVANEDEISSLIDKIALNEALKQLDDFDSQVISLRYYRCLTQTQVSKILGVSQVTVSRSEKRIIENLRQKLIT